MPVKNPKKVTNPFIRFFMVFAGIVSVALGILGIFIPILPTTPFFLLAAFFFLRSSKRLYRWLLTHKLFGNYIRNYIHYKAIAKGVKIFTLVLLWLTILYSAFLIHPLIWLQILLIAIAIAVSIHILSLRSMPKRSDENKEGLYKEGNKKSNAV